MSAAGTSVDIANASYASLIQTIRGTRPITLQFGSLEARKEKQGAPRQSAEDSSDRCDVLFTEPGSLGLKFAPKKQTGAVEVIAINEGTQATRHPQLRPGLILTAVAGTSTAGLSYRRVIDLVRSLPGRPLQCSFSAAGHEGVVAPSKDGVDSRQSGSGGTSTAIATGDITATNRSEPREQTFEESGPLGIVWRLVKIEGDEVMMVKSVNLAALRFNVALCRSCFLLACPLQERQ